MLRGMLGQVIGVANARTRVQLLVDLPLDLSTELGQQVHLASEVGLTRSEFIIVPPDQVAGRYRSFKAFRGQRKGRSPFSANAFLDTGANFP